MALVAWVSAVASVLLALLVFWASTQACLFCFTTRVARLRVCHSFVGWKDSLKVNQCLENYQLAFKKLSILEFDYNERNRLHDTFMQMTNSLQQQGLAKGPYDVAFRRAAEKQKMIILQLKRAHACTPPCAPHAEHVLLPPAAGGPRARGADPPGEAHPWGDLFLPDQARRAPRGAALLLPERHWAHPAPGDRAPGHLPGSGALGAEGAGSGGAREAQPGTAIDPPPLGPDVGRPVPAGHGHGRHGRRPDRAGVDVLLVVFQWLLARYWSLILLSPSLK
ncbi:sperm acrosome membrane-associated protein 6 isoform 3-T3 [Thomomys bottae]